MNRSDLVEADQPLDKAARHGDERKIHTFPVFPGSDEDFSIDWDDYSAVCDLLADMGVKHKLTQLQLMVKIMQGDPKRRVNKLFMPKYENITFLPSSIGRLTNLRRLFLTGKRCRGLRWLPSSIGDLKSLEHLSLRDSGIYFLPSSIGKLKKLRVLDLVNTKHLSALPHEIWNLTNLRLKMKGSRIISNRNNKFSSTVDEDESMIRRWIPCSTKKLDLSFTRVDRLPLQIRRLQNLKSLDLSFTEGDMSSAYPGFVDRDENEPLEDVGLLANEVGGLLSLEKLNLSWSSIYDFCPSIGCLTNLKELDLSMTVFLAPVLPEMIFNLTSLEKLNLSYSNIETLPTSIGHLQNLKELDLYESEIERLPASVWREINDLRNLEILRCNSETLHSCPDNNAALGKMAYESTAYWEFGDIRTWPLAGSWMKFKTRDRLLETSGLVQLDLRGRAMNPVWNTFEGLKTIIDCIPSLESLVISIEQIDEELHQDLFSIPDLGISENPMLKYIFSLMNAIYIDDDDHFYFDDNSRLLISMICKHEERKLKLALASRNGSCWSLPGLWPYKLKYLTSGIDDCDYSDRKKSLMRRLEGLMDPTVHEADFIYQFLRSTLGSTPHYLQKEQPSVDDDDNNICSDDVQDAYDADDEYTEYSDDDDGSIWFPPNPVHCNDGNPEASGIMNPKTISILIGCSLIAVLWVALLSFLGL